MSLRCPDCREPLDGERSCRNGHRFEERDGVLSLVAAGFGQRLVAFTRALRRVRQEQGRRLEDPAAYEDLPGGARVRGDFHWRLRRYDLAVLERLIDARRRLAVLDVGAWNGWLSHRLAARGHEVTAVDYFDDPFDGLGARRFYSTSWRAIQMDLTDLSLLDEEFDLVVLNRCVQFATDPVRFVAQAGERVAPGGLLVMTGLEFFLDPRVKAARVAAEVEAHREAHGFDLFLFPTRGLLDGRDLGALERLGVRFHPYPRLRWANLGARLVPTRPRHAFGVLPRAERGATWLDGAGDKR